LCQGCEDSATEGAVTELRIELDEGGVRQWVVFQSNDTGLSTERERGGPRKGSPRERGMEEDNMMIRTSTARKE
jgi:hypothetical protein